MAKLNVEIGKSAGQRAKIRARQQAENAMRDEPECAMGGCSVNESSIEAAGINANKKAATKLNKDAKAGKAKAKKAYADQNPGDDMSDEEFDKILSRVHRGSTLKEAEAGN
jgi:hypothetical protein